MVDLTPYKAGIEAARNATPHVCDDPRTAFVNTLNVAGFSLPRTLAIGRIDRIDGPEDKRGKKSGWYIYNEIEDVQNDGRIIGVANYGDWKYDINETWCSRSEHQMDATERKNYLVAREAMRIAHEMETQKKQEEAAKKAFEIWKVAPPAPDTHPYLVKKGVKSCEGIKCLENGRIVIPIAVDNQITSLQFINESGEKRFLTGGKIKGGWFIIEGENDVVYVTEGYSTGRSIHEATGKTVYICFYADNIYEASSTVKGRHEGSRVIIAGDDDFTKPGNPGRTKAEQAASGLGVECIFPQGVNDFNDMMARLGLDALRQYLAPQKIEAYEAVKKQEQQEIERPPVSWAISWITTTPRQGIFNMDLRYKQHWQSPVSY